MRAESEIQKPVFEVRLAVRGAVGIDRRSGRRGRGLFVTEPVAEGESVLAFGGELLDRSEMLALLDRDHYLQIGPDLFLGPSGDLDDYVNHSCAPSTTVVIERGRLQASLRALRALEPGDEVTFDYSTVQLDDPGFNIPRCHCDAEVCRGLIQDFSLMPRGEREALVRSGLCAWYVVERWEGVVE